MSYIKFSNLFYELSNGKVILDNISGVFSGSTALVGNNGCGKSIFSKILSGVFKPLSGSVLAGGSIYYLEQFIQSKDVSVCEELGISNIIGAIDRIENGVFSSEDYDLLDGKWDIKQRCIEFFDMFNLNVKDFYQKVSSLSGGEAAKLNLLKAFLSDADFLILDEPDNHLDKYSKDVFIKLLKSMNKDYLIITHDREILDNVSCIYELSLGNLAYYEGGYQAYAEKKKTEHESLIAKHKSAKIELKKIKREHIRKEESAVKKQAEGRKNLYSKGLPRIAAGALKSAGEESISKSVKKWDKKLSDAAELEQELYDSIVKYNISFPIADIGLNMKKTVLEAKELILPYGSSMPINFIMKGAERVCISGRNGSGKTTFVNVLDGVCEAVSGSAVIYADYAVIKQHSNCRAKSVLSFILDETLQEEYIIRNALCHINLPRDKVNMDYNLLSGGEKVKVKLLAELLKQKPPQLIILDEPDNHMDIASLKALEDLLNMYKGAVLVVSHDSYFLNNIGIDRYIFL